jgi:hypothetical protein
LSQLDLGRRDALGRFGPEWEESRIGGHLDRRSASYAPGSGLRLSNAVPPAMAASKVSAQPQSQNLNEFPVIR